MSYVITPSIGIDLTAVRAARTDGTSNPEFALGTKVLANDGVYQYLEVAASQTIAQYELVKITNAFKATAATTTTLPSTEPAKCAVQNQSSTSMTAAQCGWFFVGPGLVTVKVAASCVQDVKLYTTATQGVVDDSATTLVNGLKLITTITGAANSPCVAECELGTVLA